MALVIESTAVTANVNSNAINLTKPSGVAVGDLLVIVFGCSGQASITPPSGFTVISTYVSAGIAGNNWAGWRVADGTEGSSFAFSTATNAEQGGIVMRISGANNASPIGATANQTPREGNFQDSAFTGLSITPAFADSLLVYGIIVDDITSYGVNGYAIATSNPSWTEQCDSGSLGLDIAVATATRTAVTATGDASWNLVPADTYITVAGLMFAISPLQTVANFPPLKRFKQAINRASTY